MAVTPRPRPARVRPRADSARAVTAQVGREGGTVSVTGADGTRYTLTLPAGALLDPATITMTPIASIARLPMGARLAKAVQIGPAGRQLLKPATLAIASPRLPPRSRLTSFGFQAGGRQFHLAPVSLAGAQATIKIFQLQGHGIGSATSQARYTFSRSRFPSSVVEQLEQVVAIPRAPRGTRRAGAAQSGPRDELSAQIFALYLSIQVAALSGDIDVAVLQFVPWEALALGFAGTYPEIHAWRSALATAFTAGMQRQIAQAQTACSTNKDIAQMGRLLRYRDYLYTSLATLPIQSVRSQIDSALARCLRFELVYEVSIQGVNGYGEAVNAQVTSKVPIRMAVPGDTSNFMGEAPLEVANYSVGPIDCYTHTWNVTPASPLIIRRMTVGIMRERGAETSPPSIQVSFNLGSLDEQVTHICGDSYTDQQHAYDGVAAALLGGAAGSDFELTWLGGGSGGEYSSQSFTRSAESDGSYTGTFSFRLRHDPA